MSHLKTERACTWVHKLQRTDVTVSRKTLGHLTLWLILKSSKGNLNHDEGLKICPWLLEFLKILFSCLLLSFNNRSRPFIKFLNTSNFVKNTPLRVSVFELSRVNFIAESHWSYLRWKWLANSEIVIDQLEKYKC